MVHSCICTISNLLAFVSTIGSHLDEMIAVAIRVVKKACPEDVVVDTMHMFRNAARNADHASLLRDQNVVDTILQVILKNMKNERIVVAALDACDSNTVSMESHLQLIGNKGIDVLKEVMTTYKKTNIDVYASALKVINNLAEFGGDGVTYSLLNQSVVDFVLEAVDLLREKEAYLVYALSLVTRLYARDKSRKFKENLVSKTTVATALHVMNYYTNGRLVHYACSLLLTALEDSEWNQVVLTPRLVGRLVVLLGQQQEMDNKETCSDLIDFLRFFCDSEKASLVDKEDVAL